MPLTPAKTRETIHHRSVQCRGYRRDDGLWDIEGHLVDTKTYTFINRERGEITPGEPIHEMWLRLTVDDDLVVHEVEAATDASPFRICGDVTERFKQLRGLKIGRGWRRKVTQLLGGVHGCTHLVELLGPVATTAFQTIFPIKSRRKDARADGKRPPMLDSCHALATDSEIVRLHWPRFYTGPKDPLPQAEGE
jgi:Protein of unknown function (DUF2889)